MSAKILDAARARVSFWHGFSKSQCRTDLRRDRGRQPLETMLVIVQPLVDDDIQIAARPVGIAEATVQSHLARKIVVLHDGIPGKIRCERELQNGAGEADGEFSLAQPTFAQLVADTGGAVRGRTPSH